MMTDDEILHTALATNTTNEEGRCHIADAGGGGGLFSFLFNLNERIVWLTFSCGE